MELGLKGKTALWVVVCLVLLFLLVPLLIVAPVSFSSSELLQFPPPSYSTRWYSQYFSDSSWIDATLLSVRVALSVTVCTLILGISASIAVVRLDLPFRRLFRVMAMTPLVVPTIIVAIAVYSQYVDFHLVGSFTGVVAAHTILALPYVVLLVSNALQQADRGLEEASSVMGASRFTTMRRIVLPMLAPAVGAAGLFAFLTSWDEVIMVLFIGGRGMITLPLKMFTEVQTNVTPAVAAVSTLLIAAVTIVIVGNEVRARIKQHRVRDEGRGRAAA